MKPSRRAVVLGLALALVSAGCSRFAPKAGVGVNAVGVDLAFGIDVESLLPTTTPTQLPSFTTAPPVPTGTVSSSTPPPPPPPINEPDCLPSQTNTTRDGGAPSTMKDQEFKKNGVLGEGSRPRDGIYFTYYEFNYAGEQSHNGFSYKKIMEVNDLDTIEGFSFDVREPENGFGHGMDMTLAVVPQEGDGTNDRAGIYIQELRIPYKEQVRGEAIDKRFFTGFEPGVRLVDFPIQNGNESTDAGPVPEDPDTTSQVPTFGGAASTLTVTSVVGRQDRIFVCDRLAEAWRVAVTMELSGDVDIRIVGNFWLAPQYGGWPIQEAFTMDGGSEFRSGNFFSRIGRLDPGEVV